MAQVYKTFTLQDLDGRTVVKVSAAQTTQVSQKIDNFINLFKAKHLS